jgi:hypothetical protein
MEAVPLTYCNVLWALDQMNRFIEQSQVVTTSKYKTVTDLPNRNHSTTELIVKVKVKVTLRLAVYRQSVRLGFKPLETHDQTFF